MTAKGRRWAPLHTHAPKRHRVKENEKEQHQNREEHGKHHERQPKSAHEKHAQEEWTHAWETEYTHGDSQTEGRPE